MKKIVAKAKVKVTLELDLSDTWGSETPISQIQKQASDSAMNIVNNRLLDGGAPVAGTIVDGPHVQAIIVERE